MILNRKINTGVFLATSSLLLACWGVPAFAKSNVERVISDSAITMSIKAKMVKDPELSATSINVQTKNGKVTLAGTAKTENEATKVVELVESTEGVKDIESSNLAVDGSNQPMTDAIVTAKVKGLFIREKVFGNQPIDVTGIKVETKDAVVYLSGQVKNKNQESTAVRLAKSIAGVEKVSSSLEIK